MEAFSKYLGVIPQLTYILKKGETMYFGIGIERMVTFAAGTKHIREAIPFPRMLHRIKP